MSEPFISVNGVLGRSARVIVPWTGLPVVHVDFADLVVQPAGPVIVQIGDLTLSCVIDPARSGDYAGSSSWTLLGGRGGWRTTLPADPRHNDAMFRKSDAAQLVAAAAGEVLVVDASADGPLGVDYFRRAGAASRALELLFPTSAWWVAPDGVTHVGERPLRDVTGLVEVLELDPSGRRAVLVADDPTNLLPGCSFTDIRMPGGTFVIHDLEFRAEGHKARAMVTSSVLRDARLAGLLTAYVESAVPRLPYAFVYEYRVVTMAGDRANVQYVADPLDAKPPELPDGMPLSLAPGMAGLKGQLTPGGRVFVTFIAGNPGRPMIVGFGGADAPAFTPTSLSIDATTAVEIGRAAINAWIGQEEPNAIANPLKRFVRYGDIITNSGSPGPMPVVPDPTNVSISTAGTKVGP